MPAPHQPQTTTFPEAPERGHLDEEDAMAMSEEAFEALVLAEPFVQWELHRGQPRKKPGMSAEHNDVIAYLGVQLGAQLDRARFRVRINTTHVRRPATTYYIPDVIVIPAKVERAQRGRPLEIYSTPLPLVVEVWSPSTGSYDINEKLVEYQRRGDIEIWRIQPFEQTLTAWRRQSDGTYVQTLHRGGTVEPVALPNVTIDLDALFADPDDPSEA
jgi:Uma2 family endonuclease